MDTGSAAAPQDGASEPVPPVAAAAPPPQGLAPGVISGATLQGLGEDEAGEDYEVVDVGDDEAPAEDDESVVGDDEEAMITDDTIGQFEQQDAMQEIEEGVEAMDIPPDAAIALLSHHTDSIYAVSTCLHTTEATEGAASR